MVSNQTQIILLDNGISMKQYWDEAMKLVSFFVHHGAMIDDNGIDFYVTNYVADPDFTVKGTKDEARVRKAMEKATPKPEYSTDMVSGLGTLFWENHESLRLAQKRGIPLRKMTFFVFTDGIWAATGDRDAVGDKIVAFVKRAFNILGGDLEDRAASIQFIQFGKDPDATETLRKLDDGLEEKGIP
jgi:hypothetical protein